MAAELPAGHAQRAAVPRRRAVQRYRGRRRCAIRARRGREDRALPVPRYPRRRAAESRSGSEPDRAPGLRARAVRALGIVVAGGSSPSTVSLYDLADERARALGQPDDGRAQRHPRPRGLAVRLEAGVADALGQLRDDVGELFLPRRRDASRSAARCRARACRAAGAPAPSSPSARRAASRGNAGRPPRTAGRSARGCAAPAFRDPPTVSS